MTAIDHVKVMTSMLYKKMTQWWHIDGTSSWPCLSYPTVSNQSSSTASSLMTLIRDLRTINPRQWLKNWCDVSLHSLQSWRPRSRATRRAVCNLSGEGRKWQKKWNWWYWLSLHKYHWALSIYDLIIIRSHLPMLLLHQQSCFPSLRRKCTRLRRTKYKCKRKRERKRALPSASPSTTWQFKHWTLCSTSVGE